MTPKKMSLKISSGFALPSSPAHLLRRSQQYAFDLYSREVKAAGLTPRQFVVLTAVGGDDGLSQTELVQQTGIDRSTLAEMIARLIERGLLSRKRTSEDARANAVSLTASGHRALAQALPRVRSAENAILAPLPAGKRSEFMRSLTLIAKAADDAAGLSPEESIKGGRGRAPIPRGRRKKAGRLRRVK
jgi:DNA-binding MarR family transcriptional regulator